MELEEDSNQQVAGGQVGERKRFEVKKVIL